MSTSAPNPDTLETPTQQVVAEQVPTQETQTPSVEPNSEPTQETETSETTPKTFTQQELDAIVARRVKKFQSEVADLKKAQEEANAPKLDEAQRLAKLEADLEASRAELVARELDGAVTLAAVNAGVPASKLPFVAKLVERDGLVDESGAVEAEAVASAVKAVLDSVPELAGAPVAQDTPKGESFGNGPASTNATTPPPSWKDVVIQKYG